MSRLHLFNPGYEMAVANETVQYTPPLNVQKMRRELALLPMWYGEKEDYVLMADETPSFDFGIIDRINYPTPVTLRSIYTQIKISPAMECSPWGLSPDTIACLNRLKADHPSLIVPVWKKEYHQLSGRQTAAECLDLIRNYLPEDYFPSAPVFCQETGEIDAFIREKQPPFVLKTPFSSSGRGLWWLYENRLNTNDIQWINGALKRQRLISIELGLDKVQDFALEFYLDDEGKVSYEGISVFNTVGKGAYTGNRLDSQENLHQSIFQLTGGTYFNRIRHAVQSIIENIFGGIYSGYIGVDMLVYKTEKGNLIHPFVEINMRYTMGMVAIQLVRKHIAPSASGHFSMTYSVNAYEEDVLLKEKYPLVIENNRIRQGYLSLCPVNRETQFRTFVLVD
ncbi:hypothetical protein [Parabacteroides sp. PF5-9]|uniref:hypothetical protein n=1 Tax=Parabacteroides sp. PF5-9 TaxID=1742404 RepID=UPI002475AAAC|nr:hypothetical protein [Parabacteroides sp. PF5-9]MDH6356704.1 hypothetical protein [Parabacteroides sp. PF5-9]